MESDTAVTKDNRLLYPTSRMGLRHKDEQKTADSMTPFVSSSRIRKIMMIISARAAEAADGRERVRRSLLGCRKPVRTGVAVTRVYVCKPQPAAYPEACALCTYISVNRNVRFLRCPPISHWVEGSIHDSRHSLCLVYPTPSGPTA